MYITNLGKRENVLKILKEAKNIFVLYCYLVIFSNNYNICRLSYKKKLHFKLPPLGIKHYKLHLRNIETVINRIQRHVNHKASKMKINMLSGGLSYLIGLTNYLLHIYRAFYTLSLDICIISKAFVFVLELSYY